MATADRLIEVFNEAIARPEGAERERFLDEVCREDAALKEQVVSLLKAHEGAGDFLQKTPLMFSTPLLTEKPGDRIGRYKLLEQIGEGGCGVVYMAEQEEPVRRRVALKVIKLGMDTKQVIARFEAERQALALMDHPNIAKVLDAGATETGRPFFVMELVRGIRITDYCDQNNLSTPERLELFIQVCQAIQHAHQKGIIHRDIKPSNILVTQHDDVAVPKVIDFGIAKATTGQLTDKTLFTAFAQFIGTPAYMSPEQAQLSGLDIDTRADIYSLGVLLYELLTGQTPFDQKELLAVGLDEMRRIIREKEPPKPSTRLTQELVTADVRRRTSENTDQSASSPRRLQELIPLIRGDLDWLVMKCLEKDRTRRYETANALALDLQRHLKSEPVEARPPSNVYRFQKLVHRNKLAFAAASAVVAALILGLGASTWMFFKEKQAREKARLEAVKSQQVAQFLKDMLEGVQPSVALGRDTTMLREILNDTAKRLTNLKDQPAVEADLRTTLGNVYFDLGELTNAAAMHRESLGLRRKIFGREHLESAAGLDNLARVLQKQGSHTEAETLLREALAMRRRLVGNDNNDVVGTLYSLSFLQRAASKLPESETTAREALAMCERLFGHEHIRTGDMLHLLAMNLNLQGKHAEAEAISREELAVRRKLLGNEHREVAFTLADLAIYLGNQGKWTEAEAVTGEVLTMSRKVIGYENPDVAHTLHQLAWVLGRGGKWDQAEDVSREELALRRKLLGNEHPDVAETLVFLAIYLKEQGELPEAEIALREALAIDQKKLGDDHSVVAGSRRLLSELLGARGDFSEAESLCREELSKQIKRNGYFHREVDNALVSLARLLEEQGKWDEAEVVWREELAVEKRLSGNEHPFVANSLETLGSTLHKAGKRDEAETVFREALAMRRKLLGNENSSVASLLSWLGATLLSQQKHAEAEAVYRELLALRKKLPADDAQLDSTLASLSRTLLNQEKFIEAEPFARECLEIREKKSPDDWRTFNARSMVGAALLGLKRYADAEPLLISSYDGMKQREEIIPAASRVNVKEAIKNLVKLYEAKEQPEDAARWKKQLAEFDKAEPEKKAP